MMLYKYVSFATGKAILEKNAMGFSQPKFFNDPFDLPSYPPEPSANPIDGMFGQIRTWGKNRIWGENTGILSLTRTPTNPLMWAHYADKHEGVVIGIDAVVAGLTHEDSNLIPAQYGSVVYVSRRSSQPFVGKFKTAIEVDGTHHFPHDHYEKLQRVFLHKPLCWSYEEEVRVVKCLKGISTENADTQSGHFEIVDAGRRDLYLLSLPPGSIQEVYFGIRADIQTCDDLFCEATKLHPNLSVFESTLDMGNLTVGFGPLGLRSKRSV
jgi:Protein of unknown function (DUF2971)